MRGIMPRLMQSLVWAGLISNALAIVVCFICKDQDNLIGSTVDYIVWVMQYIFQRKVLKTW